MVNIPHLPPSPHILHWRHFARALNDRIVVHNNGGSKFADPRQGPDQSGGKIKAAALPISRQVLCPMVDRSIRLDFSWTADAYEGSEIQAFLVSGSHQLPHHLNEFLNRIITAELLFAVPPQLEIPNLGFAEVSGMEAVA
jgi:hypothetical protein